MGKLLEELVETINEKASLDEKVLLICDQILSEEKEDFAHPDLAEELLEGANMFLVLEIFPQGVNDEASFLCLERESPENYIATVWSKPKTKMKKGVAVGVEKSIKRTKVIYGISEGKPEGVLVKFAGALEYTKGKHKWRTDATP